MGSIWCSYGTLLIPKVHLSQCRPKCRSKSHSFLQMFLIALHSLMLKCKAFSRSGSAHLCYFLLSLRHLTLSNIEHLKVPSGHKSFSCIYLSLALEFLIFRKLSSLKKSQYCSRYGSSHVSCFLQGYSIVHCPKIPVYFIYLFSIPSHIHKLLDNSTHWGNGVILNVWKFPSNAIATVFK